MISCLMRPQYVLDIGTFTGYSALCLAEGLSPDGKLYTLDNNDEAMEVARGFINRSAYAGNIVPLCGDAAESIASLNDTVPHWDIIWIDADKERYSLYYKLCLDKLRPGGLIMADNVLWSGKVADPTESGKDRDTAALREFNDMVNGDQRVENMLLPLRDGIMMARKR